MNAPGGGAARSLWEPWAETRPGGPLLQVWEQNAWTILSWDQWRIRAARFAGGLRRLGVTPGDRVACQLTNSAAGCSAVLGTWLAGGCLVSIPGIARGMTRGRYVAQLGRIVTQAQPTVVLVDATHVDELAEACPGVLVRTVDRVDGPAVSDPMLAGDAEPVFVQFSSGSTTEPRGCVLSAGAIATQLELLARALDLDPEVDVKVDWLPLSHDMGLFACLLLSAYWTGVPQVLSTPERFVLNPTSWFADCASFGATISCAPNFALELTAKIAKRLPSKRVPMRCLVVGGEMVNPGTLERALLALGPDRLSASALCPAYGLAEAVLAVTLTRPGDGPATLTVDRDALADARVQPVAPGEEHSVKGVRVIASAGMALPGVTVSTSGGADVGEVIVDGPILADGYLNAPKLTADRFTNQGLRTGDLGFIRDGQLYLTGRGDDLLIIAGRNVYARDIEAALIEVAGVQPGACAVVALEHDPERLVAVLEPGDSHPDLTAMAGLISDAAREAVGVRLHGCVFLAPGRFPKTPSGKAQRFRCQDLASEQGSTPNVKRIEL